MCIDYKSLNQQTRLEKQPLPKIDYLLDQLFDNLCLSIIDLHTGHHQIAIRWGDEYKTVFFIQGWVFWVSSIAIWFEKYLLYILEINE